MSARIFFLLLLSCVIGSGASTAATTEVVPKIRIAFAGDSIVDNYWSGILRIIDANPCLKSNFELGRFARNGTGLTRGDRVYWPREIKRIGETFGQTLTVISIGLNDRQFIVDGDGARTAWGAPNWTDKYKEQIFAFLQGSVAGKATVLMIGLPAMRESIDNADVAEKNAMYLEVINQLGSGNLHYIEPWKLKPSGADTFASFGPDKNGKLVQIRTSDGQHFTVAGEDLVAAYLFPQIMQALSDAHINVGQCSSKEAKDTH